MFSNHLLDRKIQDMLYCLRQESREENRRIQIDRNLTQGKYKLVKYREDYYKRIVMYFSSEQTTDKPSIFKGDDVSLTYADGISEDKFKGISKNGYIKGISIGSKGGHLVIVFDIVMSDFKNIFKEPPCNETYIINVYSSNQTVKIIKGIEIYKGNFPYRTTRRILGTIVGSEQPTTNGHNVTEYYISQLNNEQKETVKLAMNQNELAIIHGPPGTGKTITLVEIILQEVFQGRKVLVCAPSNVACDNITEKLEQNLEKLKKKIKIVRLGHPARQFYHLIKYSIDNHIEWYVSKEEKDSLLASLLPTFDVIITTLAGSHPKGYLRHLKEKRTLIIDESCQAIEAVCWLPIQFASKAILAGDFLQLPPIIMCQNDRIVRKLKKTLLERLYNSLNNSSRTLYVQYRMNQMIMTWPSEKFYNNQLVAFESIKDIQIKNLPGVRKNNAVLAQSPLMLIDTSNSMIREIIDPKRGCSRANYTEVKVVEKVINYLNRLGVENKHISIITPYNYQVELIIKQLGSREFEIGSVDKFQGRESEVIILSMVRSNEFGQLGFVKDPKRLNVAITRAKRLLVVIGDTSTLNHSPDIKQFIQFIKTNGKVFPFQRFLDDYFEQYLLGNI